MENQKGAISIFVVLSMLFLLAIIVGIYTINAKRAQTQTESVELVKDKYYTEGEENAIYQARIADATDTIPIYTKEQLWLMRTDANVEIEGIIYEFLRSGSYELQNDIIINIEEDMEEFDDTYLDENGYEIYYYDEDSKSYYDLAEGSTYDLEVDGIKYVLREETT